MEEGTKIIEESKIEVEFTCTCCFCPAEPHEIVQMPDCGHRLCDECFAGYLQTKLSSGPEVVNSLCPDQKCRNIIPERIFKQLLNHEEFVKYKQFYTSSFIDLNKNIKWCPGKNCTMVCESKLGEVVDI